MLMDLAKYYAMPENQPYWSVAFMLFSGEEAGLKGSKHYVNNPLFMLEGINLLINLDTEIVGVVMTQVRRNNYDITAVRQ